MIKLKQYIQAMDCLTMATPEMTATDLYMVAPDDCHKLIKVMTGNDVPEQSPTVTIGQLEICLSRLTFPEPSPVLSIKIGEKIYSPCDALVTSMDDDYNPVEMPYGELDFGTCMECFALLDKTTYKHRALPMLLAYLYTDGETKFADRIKDMLKADAQDANSVFFYLIGMGLGLGNAILSHSLKTIEHQSTN